VLAFTFRERPLDQQPGDQRLAARAKIVRPGWVPAGDEHWSKHPLETNRLAGGR